MVKRSKTYGLTFKPTLTREEYFATTIFSHRHKPEIVGLFAALLERQDISGDQLGMIAELVAKKEHKFMSGAVSDSSIFAIYARK